MPNDCKFSKPVNSSLNSTNDILRERREAPQKPGDGTMTFMVWSIAGTVLAACSGNSPLFGGGTDLAGGGGGSSTPAGGNSQGGPANTGTLQDGPVRGGRFFIDQNENGEYDGGDIFLGETNAVGDVDFGEYSINIGDVVSADATGAIDLATGETLSGVFRSLPYDGSGEVFISPLTDLLADADAGLARQTMLNEIFGDGVITVADILNRDYYNPFDDGLKAQLISQAAIALTEIEAHGGSGDRDQTLEELFATYRTGGLVDGEVPLAEVVLASVGTDPSINLKDEVDGRLGKAAERGDAPVVVDPNGGEPIRIMEDEEVKVADLLSSYSTSEVEGSAQEHLFGFEDPLGGDNLEGVFIQAESVDSEGNPTFAYVRFRQDDDTVVRLANAPADQRGVPSDAPEGFDEKMIDGQQLYYVSAENIDRLILEPGAGVEGDFGIRYYVYDGSLITEGDGTLDIAVDSTNDAPTAIMASSTTGDTADDTAGDALTGDTTGDTALFAVLEDSMPEESAEPVLVTAFATADPDEIDTHTYSIPVDAMDHFMLDGNKLFFLPDSVNDMDMPMDGFVVDVTSTDSEGEQVSQSFTFQGISAPSLVAGADLDVVSGSDAEASGQITQLTSDRIHLFGSGSGDDYFVSSSDTTNDQDPAGTVLTGTYGNMYLRTDGSWDYRLTSQAYTLAGRTGQDTFQVRYQFGGEASGPVFDINIEVEGPTALILSAPTGNPQPTPYHTSGLSHANGGTFQAMLDGGHVVPESDLTYGIGLTEEAALARLEGGGVSHQRFNDGEGRFTISDTGTWSYNLFDPALIEEKANNIDAFRTGDELVVQKVWVAARTPNGEVGAVEVDVPIKGLTVEEGSGGVAGNPRMYGEGGARSTLRSDADSDVKLLLGTGFEEGITFRGRITAGRDTITANGDAGDVNLIFANTNYDTINLDRDTTDIVYHRIQTGPGLDPVPGTPRSAWKNIDGGDTINGFRRGQDKIVFVDVDELLPANQQGAAGFSFSTHVRDTYIDFSALIDRTRDSVNDPWIETIIGFEIDFRTDDDDRTNPGYGNIKVYYHEDDRIVTGSSEVHNRYYGNHLGDFSNPGAAGRGDRHIGENSKWQNYFGPNGYEVIDSGLLPPAIQVEIDKHIDQTGQFAVESTHEGRLEHDVATDGDLFYGMGLTEQDARTRLDGSASHERFNDGAGILTISDTGTYSYTLHTRDTIETNADSPDAFRAGHEVVVQTLWVAVRAQDGTVDAVQVDVPVTGLNVVEGPGGSQLNVVNEDRDQSGAELLLGTGYGEIRPGSVAGDAYRGRDEINADGPVGDVNLIFANTHADAINLHRDTTDIIYHRIQTGSHDLGNPNVESTDRHGWRNVDGGDTINGFRRGQDRIVFVDIDGLLPEDEQGAAEFDFNANVRNRYVDFYALVEWTGTHEEIIGFQIHFKTDNGDGLFPGHGDIKFFYDSDQHIAVNTQARESEFFGDDVGEVRSFSGAEVSDVNNFTPGDEYREIHDYSLWGRYFGLAGQFGTNPNGFEFVHTGLLPAGVAAEVAKHIDPDTEQYAAGEGAATFILTAPMGIPRPAHYHFSGRSSGGAFQGRLNNDVVAAGDLTYGIGSTEEAALARLEGGGASHQRFNDGVGRFTISDTGTWSYTLLDVAPVEEKAHNLDAFRAGNELVVQTVWVAALSPDGEVDTVEVDVPIRGLTVVEGSGGRAGTNQHGEGGARSTLVSDGDSDIKLLLGTGFDPDLALRGSILAGEDTITANGDAGDVNLIFANRNADTINLDEDTTDIIYHTISTGILGERIGWRNVDGADTINGFRRGQDKIVFVDLDGEHVAGGEIHPSGFYFHRAIGDRYLDFDALVERTRNDQGEQVEMITGFQIRFSTDPGFITYPGYGAIRVYYHEDDQILAHGHAFHAEYFGLHVGDVERSRDGQEYRFIYDTSKWENYFGDGGLELVENGLLPPAIQSEVDRHIDSTGQYVEDNVEDGPVAIDLI